MKRIILASASPRRHELLNLLGVDHDVIPCHEEERMSALVASSSNSSLSSKEELDTLDEELLSIACHKVRCVARGLDSKQFQDALIIGADTIVILEGEILGKPSSREKAVEMLRKITGKTHEVRTGICIFAPSSGKLAKGVEKTLVRMIKCSEEIINAYTSIEEPLDKAGGYAIQGKGAALIDRIEGCYYNVMGLPLSRLISMLAEFGYDYFPK